MPGSRSLDHLTAENLSLRMRDGTVVVADASLAIASGMRVAIVGPNGAGKTSLLRMLFGRIKPTAGRVLIGGQPLAEMPLAERARRIAVVAQGDLPDMRLTVGDYVELGRIPHQWRVAAS